MRAFCLGAALAVGVLSAVSLTLRRPWSAGSVVGQDDDSTVAVLAPLWRLPFFLAALATFHFLEFWTTAQYNTQATNVGSFLLTANWPGYAIAHVAASTECLLRYTLFRHHRWPVGPLLGVLGRPEPASALTVLGFAVVIVGQAVRTAAMVQAGRSFNHMIQHERADGHMLVTTGVYRWLRHPSYFGFFWWALGTQLVLGNVVCLAGYATVLWRFFSLRIRHEERLLVRFFGDDYVAYRQRVGTKIPFV